MCLPVLQLNRDAVTAAIIEFNVVLSIAYVLSDALVSLEATATMTLGNRLLTLSRSEATHDRDEGMASWMEVWRDCENSRGTVCNGEKVVKK